ncbi:hypothetical protein [Algoriphagus boritolerans]|uniref:hypothetical protein n=1 Tax=Algoriphagus boritolerans TaxID=308111 RepID=UPI002FCE3BC2
MFFAKRISILSPFLLYFYEMPVQRYIPSNPKKSAYIVGSTFLFLYWLIGFDGITFSDDVYYLLAGNKFWDGTMEFNEFHFSTRWGAYVPSGLIGFLFGFDPHRISMISLFSYLGTLYLVLKILPKDCNPWVLVTWMVTQVYLLHFLTKVYPDSLLVFWTILIPFSATFRSKKPFLAALGLISGLFFWFPDQRNHCVFGSTSSSSFYFRLEERKSKPQILFLSPRTGTCFWGNLSRLFLDQIWKSVFSFSINTRRALSLGTFLL